jgi:hypothetical protein
MCRPYEYEMNLNLHPSTVLPSFRPSDFIGFHRCCGIAMNLMTFSITEDCGRYISMNTSPPHLVVAMMRLPRTRAMLTIY